MGLPINISKVMVAGVANNIALSQSPGAGAIVLNGALALGGGAILTTKGLGAITAGSGYKDDVYRNVPATGGSGTGAVFGSIIITAGAVVAVSMIGGSPGSGYVAADSLGAAVANLGGIGSGFAVAVAAGGVTTNIATLDTQRRVIVTSGSNDTGITFTVVGTDDNGNPVSDTFAGASGGAATSNKDFKTVSSVSHSGTVAGTVTVGTNTVGSTPWIGLNWHAQPFNVSLAAFVDATGCNYTVEYTYHDPNNLPSGVTFPTPFPQSQLTAKAVTADGQINDPVTSVRFTINSGTGVLRGTVEQAGLSGQ